MSEAVAKAGKKKKNTGESINAKLALVMKSGKTTLGYKSTLKTLRQGKCAPLTLERPAHPSARDAGRAALLTARLPPRPQPSSC